MSGDDKAGTDPADRVDLEDLVQRNAPLADLISKLQMSNTWRDSKSAIAEDLSIALKARDEQSELSMAFTRYEEQRLAREEVSPLEVSRKELAAEILSELNGDSD